MAFHFQPDFEEKLHPRGLGGKFAAKPHAPKVPVRRRARPAPAVKPKPAKAVKAVKAVTPKPAAKVAKKAKSTKPMRFKPESADKLREAAGKAKGKAQDKVSKITSTNVFRGEAVEIPEQPKQKGKNAWELRWDEVDDAVLKRNVKLAIVDSPKWAQEHGRKWYSDVSSWIDDAITHPEARKPDGSPYTKEEAAAVIAMYSGNNSWLPNLRQGRDFILGKEAEKAQAAMAKDEKPHMHYHPTTGMLERRYKDPKTKEPKVLTDRDGKLGKIRDWFRNTPSGSSKVKNFTANLSGDETALTADRFVARITLHTDDDDYAAGMLSAARTRADGTKEQYGYNRIAAAYTAAVAELRAEYPQHYGDLTNAGGQAIPWLVIGGDGTGIAIPHHLKTTTPGWETGGPLGPKLPDVLTDEQRWKLHHPETPEDKARADAYLALQRSRTEADAAAKTAETQEAYQKWLDQPSEIYPSMTRREEGAVKTYVRGGYQAVGNAQLNEALRTRPDELTAAEKAQRDLMDKAVLSAPLDRPLTVQRVITDPEVRAEILANIDDPDYRYVDHGFMSMEAKGTSPDMEQFAQRYGGDTDEFDRQIFIEADLPEGTRLLDVGNVPEAVLNDPEFQFAGAENEVIMPRGTSWRIVGHMPGEDAPAPVIAMEPESPTIARIPPEAGLVGRLQQTRPDRAKHLQVGRTSTGTMNWEARGDYIDQRLTELRAQGTDTESRYRDPNTKKWSKDRLAQQNALMDAIWAEKAAHVPNEGKAIFAGGLGGAGKGHVLGKIEKVDPDQFFTINPDDIKEAMASPKWNMIPMDIDPNMTPMELSPVTHEEASDMANRLARRAYKERKNVVWDITMSSEGSVAEKRIKPMREAGYDQISAVFVDTTVDRSVEQAKGRWLRGMNKYLSNEPDSAGGRFLPSSATKENLPTEGSGFRSKNREVFEKVKLLFDGWVQYENLTGDTKHVEEGGGGLLR